LARLPNADKAIIDRDKIRGYVLSSTHPVGRFKAAFFGRFGYSAEKWMEFEQRLRELILSQDVAAVEETQYGRKYVVEGSIGTPAGKALEVVTVWVILKEQSIPRFITAYPGGLR
jgi:hypothetical protein